MNASILIPWRSDDGHRERVLEWILRRYAVLYPEAQVVLGTNDEEPFNRGAARNDAAARADHDVFVIADADTICAEAGALPWAVEAVDAGLAPWVIPYAEEQYYNLSAGATESLLHMDPDVRLAPNPRLASAWEHKITSWAGMLVMTRAAFEAVGGYDERFHGWGYEDNAFRHAMDTIVGLHKRLEGSAWHLWHPIAEGTNFDQPHIVENRRLYRRYCDATGRPSDMRQVVQDR